MISIIIPVLNEAGSIGKLLDHLCENASKGHILEILIVDGNSDDGTVQEVSDHAESSTFKISVILSERGRANQMNAGAKAATGSILYFLHADSFPPKNFDTYIISEINQGSTAGCFRMKFDSMHPVLKVSEWFTRLNYKFCRGGDQSLFIKKEAFETLGGFDEAYIIYEDCEFINRIYDRFKFSIIPKYIITSSRKYHQIGTWKLQYHFAVIHIKKRRGAGPRELYAYYKKYIQQALKADSVLDPTSKMVTEK
ncbi:TIGR04283 family arsenosugar biosynthesis glycosyltransferase [Constantimarinum furrinae]|uniref:Glycosyl transferase n=1 Tax=Constantimarinum furrinae TaxID=2562285 RepID=A0A7G8PS08_9FLAO|nr:TIGR04283 family arsenosugar biosynthesis glycosyltransferase [Constantimarinum furrinae]QNJ97124.1 Glycosyl transferase [Constantimarinum furrinae]